MTKKDPGSESQDLAGKLADLVSPYLRSNGLLLWGVEAPKSGCRGTVRIFIDSPLGITIDDCAKVSRHLDVLLDVEDMIPHAYLLEVSSPGLSRRFFKLEQMADYIGSTLEARLVGRSSEGRKKYSGVLTELGDDFFTLNESGELKRLNWQDVAIVRLVYQFMNNKK